MIYLAPRKHYDKAIIKIENEIVYYDYKKLIDCIMDELECSEIDAIDWYCYNIMGSQMPGWPVVIDND